MDGADPAPLAGSADPAMRALREAVDAEAGRAAVAEVHGLLSKKWTLAVLHDLGLAGKTRFRDLVDGNPGLTPRVLCRRLDDLVDRGLVLRTGSGKGVRYGMTPRGLDFLPIVEAACDYGARHGEPAGGPLLEAPLG